MEYVLIDRGANVISRVDLGSGVGITGAKTYFLGVKRIDEKEFDNMWRVMSENDYDLEHKRSLHNRQIEWWREDSEIIDDELKW